MVLYEGRPDNSEGRSEKEMRVYDLLESLGIQYMRVDHEPADNMNACSEINKMLGAKICKNLFLCNRQKTDFYLVMMPGDKPFKTKELSGQIGCSRLSFAGSEEMQSLLDIEPGSVSVLGLMNDTNNNVRLLVDEDILNDEYIGCHPCIFTSSLKIKTKDIFGPLLKAMNHDMTVVKLTGE